MDVVKGDEALDSIGLPQTQQEADVGAPVVPDEQHAWQLERVEQGQDVAREALLLVAAGGRLGPAKAPQVWAKDTVVLGEPWDDVTPGVPMLWPTVEKNERRARGSRSGHVHAQPGRLDNLVIHSREGRQVVQHSQSSLRPLLDRMCLVAATCRTIALGRRRLNRIGLGTNRLTNTAENGSF